MAFPTGYTKYQEVTIDHTKVSADQTDFIVYVNLADLVKAGADIFDTCRTDGGDIRATKSDGTTQLATDLVVIDTTAKTGELHIKFTGTLSSSVDTIIRIYYNGTDTALATTDTYGRNNVWSSKYDLVHHFQDATTNSVNGNTPASNTFSYATSGKMGKGINQTDGSTRGMDWGTSVPMNSSTMSMSAWFNTNESFTQDNGGMVLFVYTRAGSPYEGIYLRMVMSSVSGDRGKMTLGMKNSSSVSVVATSPLQYNDGAWHLAHGTYDGSTLRLYIDGSLVASASHTGTPGAGFKSTVGTTWDEASSDVWVDDYDEVRTTDGATLSASWALTEYRNQNSPSTFYSVGAEAGGSTSVTASPAVLAMTFSLPASTVTAVRNVSTTPSPLTLTMSIPAPTVSGGARVTPSPLTATFSLPTPNILTPDSYYQVTAPLSLTLSIPASTVTAEASVSTTPSVLALTFSTPAPTISVGTGVIASPSPLSATFSIPASTITVVSNISVTPDVLSLVLSIPVARAIADFWEDKFATPSDPFVDKVYNAGDSWSDKY